MRAEEGRTVRAPLSGRGLGRTVVPAVCWKVRVACGPPPRVGASVDQAATRALRRRRQAAPPRKDTPRPESISEVGSGTLAMSRLLTVTWAEIDPALDWSGGPGGV